MLSAICKHGYKYIVREGLAELFPEQLGKTHALQSCGYHTVQFEF